MADEKLIQISFQIPASELTGITALVEQIRELLTAGKQKPTTSGEIESNTDFDEARFQKLTGASISADLPAVSQQPETAEFSFSDIPAADSSGTFSFSTLESTSSRNALLWQQLQTDTVRASAESDLIVDTLKADAEADIFVGSLRTSAEKEMVTPPTADFAVSSNISTFLPERQRDAEQLLSAGPAPLTAEAVSLAFRRDDRRYDNGFPLY